MDEVVLLAVWRYAAERSFRPGALALYLAVMNHVFELVIRS